GEAEEHWLETNENSDGCREEPNSARRPPRLRTPPGEQAEVDADRGADHDIGRIMPIQLHPGPDDGKGKCRGQDSKGKLRHEQCDCRAENRRGMAGRKALESAAQRISRAIKTI